MKRTKLFGLMMALVVGMGFTSCSEDDDAFINITVEGNVAETLTVGESVTISYSVVSSDRLDIIEHLINNVVVEDVEDFTSNTSHTGSFTITAEEVGTIYATIRVSDRKGKVEPRNFTIEVESSIETYTAVLLGSQHSTEGSFYSTSTNEVFTLAQVAEKAALVDFIYFFGNNNKAAISAPVDNDVQAVYGGIADWSVKNETLFSLSSMTATEFAAITDNDAAIVAATANTDLFLNRVALLAEGNIVAFVTDAGKKGVFKVSSIEGTTYGEESKITLEVKVQK